MAASTVVVVRVKARPSGSASRPSESASKSSGPVSKPSGSAAIHGAALATDVRRDSAAGSALSQWDVRAKGRSRSRQVKVKWRLGVAFSQWDVRAKGGWEIREVARGRRGYALVAGEGPSLLTAAAAGDGSSGMSGLSPQVSGRLGSRVKGSRMAIASCSAASLLLAISSASFTVSARPLSST